jgi:ribosome-binding factor A
VTVTGSDEEAREALVALHKAATFVRRQLSLIYDLPRVPLLHFVRDTVEERAARVDELLMNLEREGAFKKADPEEGDAPPDEVGHTRSNA